MSRRDEPGTVYLIHFDRPVADHARHYLGWTSDLPARLDDHRQGRGARLMEVVRERGIGWHLTRTWEGTRTRERAIKARAEGPRLCPDCTPCPRPVTRGRSASPAPAARPTPEPVRDPGPAAAWPGRPLAPEAKADFYARHEAAVDGLIAGWRAAVGLAVPAPRQPEPEPELEMEIEI
jgi:predicted GIY-YIG superfamily endonuclease